MLQKNNRVDFIGFTPSAEHKWLVEAQIVKLMDRAPGHAMLSGVICSEAEGYSAKIRIDSFGRHFETYATSQDLYGLMNKVDEDFSTQFAQWKRERFAQQLA